MNNKNKSRCLFIIVLVSLLLSMFPVQSVIIDTGVDIDIENETYRVDAAMNFSRVVITDTYPIFNNTGFNVTAPDDILFVLYYINQSTINAGSNDKLVEVSIYLLGVASTTVKISGFVGNTVYEVFDNSISQGNFLSDIDGNISLTVDIGPSTLFEIRQTSTTNTAPVISNPFPVDGATGVSVVGSPVNIDAVDSDGDPMKTDVWTNASGTWKQVAGWDVWYIDQTNWSRRFILNDGSFNFQDAGLYFANEGNESNGTRFFVTNVGGSGNTNISVTQDWGMTTVNTIYWWSVNCTDNTDWKNTTYSFTTASNTAPTLSNPSPGDGVSGVGVGTSSISIDIADLESTFNWSITTSSDVGNSSANGASDGSKTCSVAGLTYDAAYLWTVSVTDGSLWTNTTYSFSVESDPGGGPPPNSAPVVSNPYPSDGATLVHLTPIVHVLVTDANIDDIDVNFYNSTDGVTWTWRQINSSVTTGTTIYWDYSQASLYDTLYYWKVTADDGSINISHSYSFTTWTNTPQVNWTLPADGAVDISLNGSIVNANIFDYQGDLMNVTIWSNFTGSWVKYAGYGLDIYSTWFIRDNNGDGKFLEFATYQMALGMQGNGTRGFYEPRSPWNYLVTDDWGMTDYNTRYYISLNISDDSTERAWNNHTFSFTTELNNIPIITDPIPRSGKVCVSIYIDDLSVMVTDANSDFNYTIETSPDIGNISENDVVDGVKTCTVSGLNYSIVYTWFVNVTDGEDWVNTSYTFTTKSSTDFDLEGFKLNLPEWALGPFKVYVGDFVWMFIFVGVIAITWGSSKHISSVLMVILLLFAAYGTQRVFVDNSEISLLFSIVAAASVAAIMLGLFLRKRNG